MNGMALVGISQAGCVRYRESFDERVHKTAQSEIGVDVVAEPGYLQLIDHIYDDKTEAPRREKVREHFISILFDCHIAENEELHNADSKELEGHCGWLNELPGNLLKAQFFYADYIKKLLRREEK